MLLMFICQLNIQSFMPQILSTYDGWDTVLDAGAVMEKKTKFIPLKGKIIKQ